MPYDVNRKHGIYWVCGLYSRQARQHSSAQHAFTACVNLDEYGVPSTLSRRSCSVQCARLRDVPRWLLQRHNQRPRQTNCNVSSTLLLVLSVYTSKVDGGLSAVRLSELHMAWRCRADQLQTWRYDLVVQSTTRQLLLFQLDSVCGPPVVISFRLTTPTEHIIMADGLFWRWSVSTGSTY